jgi:transcriptional regulator with XRE-family HTH domain
MALKFNIGQQAYSDLEMGNTNFTDKKISQICEIFNITFQEFLSIESADLTKKHNILSENVAVHILKLRHKKELLERDLKIVQLEIELKKHKKSYQNIENVKPIYVMI